MPEAQQIGSTTLDLSLLSKAVKATKGKPKAKKKPTLPSGYIQPFPSNVPELEVGSAMKKPKKALPSVEERVQAAIDKAVRQSKARAARKIIVQALVGRTRHALNLAFHDQLSPADIDRFAQEAANAASYDLGELEEVPTFLKDATPGVVAEDKNSKGNYTAEPTDEDHE